MSRQEGYDLKWEEKLKDHKDIYFLNEPINDLLDIIYLHFIRREANYYKSESNNDVLFCRSGRARTIQDCYLLYRHYGIKVTMTGLRKIVESLYGRFLHRSHCHTIHRRVHSGTGRKDSIGRVLEDNGTNIKVNQNG